MTTTTCCNDSLARIPDRHPVSALAERVQGFTAWLRKRQTRRELARLPDYLLNDIGLVRTGTGFTRINEARPLYRAELFGDHLYYMTREKRQ